MENKNENITYEFKDENSSNDNLCEIEKLLSDFEQIGNVTHYIDSTFNNKISIEHDDMYTEMVNYDMNFTVKHLLLICDYYGLMKDVRTNKMKKQDEEESDDSDSDEEEEENVRVINISESLLHSVDESGEVEEIPSENNDDMNDSSEDDDDLDEDDKSSVTSEEETKVEVVKLNEVMEEPQEFEPESLLDIDATLLKSIHMTFPTSENIDYKKLSLNKLRQIVSDKNLSSDSSKLKKPELLKLLGVE